MPEDQRLEWKSSWKEDFLKWIAAFANASGGRLEIGKNDQGKVIGLRNSRKLLEDLPNKIQYALGIIADVELHQERGKDWISITVPPYPYPINYLGRYFYRTGSTTQELRGASLDRFLLGKKGRTWDSVPEPHVSVSELSSDAFQAFKAEARRTNRLSQEELRLDRTQLLEKLHLTEGNYLTRAALLHFHPEPERFITGAYLKIGYFRTDTDLRYQDEIRGPLIQQVEQTLDVLHLKYFRALISYDDITRVETYPYPRTALREAILNAVAHKDYSSGNPIQIKVYHDKLSIWNAGALPPQISIADLSKAHASFPFNPDVAATFFRAGMIEAWGRGTIMMKTECEQWGIPSPSFSSHGAGMLVHFFNNQQELWEERASEKPKADLPEVSLKILQAISKSPSITAAVLAARFQLTERTIERHLKLLRDKQLIVREGSRKKGAWKIL